MRISDWSSDVCSSDLRFGDGVLCDAVDAAVAADEDHVERDQRVLHPEARDPGLGKGKEHAAVLRQFGAKHQRLALLFLAARDLDGKAVDLAVGGACSTDRMRLGGGSMGAARAGGLLTRRGKGDAIGR